MKPHDAREQQSSSTQVHPDAANWKKQQRQHFKTIFGQTGIILFVLFIASQTEKPPPTHPIAENGLWTFKAGELNRPSQNFKFVSKFRNNPERVYLLQSGLAPTRKKAVEKQTWRSYFGDEPNLFNILYALIWKIPWASRFGKFFEGIPLLISFFWLALWFLIHHFVSAQAQLLGEESSGSFSVLFTEFTQFVYLFCFLQALF